MCLLSFSTLNQVEDRPDPESMNSGNRQNARFPSRVYLRENGSRNDTREVLPRTVLTPYIYYFFQPIIVFPFPEHLCCDKCFHIFVDKRKFFKLHISLTLSPYMGFFFARRAPIFFPISVFAETTVGGSYFNPPSFVAKCRAAFLAYAMLVDPQDPARFNIAWKQ